MIRLITLVLAIFSAFPVVSPARAASLPIGETQVIILLKQSTSEKSARPEKLQFIAETAAKSFIGSFRGLRLAETHWVNTSVSARVARARIHEIEADPRVERVIVDQPGCVYFDAPTAIEPELRLETPLVLDAATMPYNQRLIHLDEVHARFPGIDGKGVVLGAIDTGIDGAHPLLQNKVIRFFDAKAAKEGPAVDKSGHGTHTAGIMLADGGIGVAPGAHIIGASGLDDLTTLLRALDWILKDGNRPRVMNNSWSLLSTMPRDAVYRAIETADKLGVFMVFSAGNAGPNPKTLTIPHEHPLAFAVADIDENSEVAGHSSRGPGIYLGQETQKPDLSAPGEEIYSTMPYRRMGAMSGTSMAAPHVAAVLALLLQANPALTNAQLRELLLTTGTNRTWDPALGFGKLDAFALLSRVTKQ